MNKVQKRQSQLAKPTVKPKLPFIIEEPFYDEIRLT